MSDELLCSVENGVATVTMNRPEKRNAMNGAMLDQFAEIFTQLETDRAVRVVVIRGEGPVFSAGRDLREMRGRQEGQGSGDPDKGVVEVFQQVASSRHPVIAMVQGDALAGGCELALHCDLRVVSTKARFGMPLARIGLVINYPLVAKLVEIIGPAFTKQILLTAQPFSAARAYEIGMVHQLVEPEQLEGATAALAATIAANAPLSLLGMKQIINRVAANEPPADIADLDALVLRSRDSADAREGVRAFTEKRQPVFIGE